MPINIMVMKMRNKKKFDDSQRKQIRHWKKKIKILSIYKKIEILDYAAKEYTNSEISNLTGYTIRRISALINEYLQNGISYFLEEHRKGGNRRRLTNEQESSLLEKFREKAEKGQVVNLIKLKEEYDKVCGKETANSTFYDFLKRMGWRRVMPRGVHPKKASDEVIEASKKLTLN
jgi:transposase